MSNTITTNRTLSFVTLSDGSLHTFEERPRSVQPEGLLPMGTVLTFVRREGTKGLTGLSQGIVPSNSEVYTDAEGNVYRLHPNHIKERVTKARGASGPVAATGPRVQEMTIEQLQAAIVAKQQQEAKRLMEAQALLEAAGFQVAKAE